MNRLFYPLIVTSFLFASAQGIAGSSTAHHKLTATIKTQDGKNIRCDVRQADEHKVRALKKGEVVRYYINPPDINPIMQ